MHPDQRRSHVERLAAANNAETPLLMPNTTPTFPIRIAKGRPVPPWLQRSSHPAFFGTDVEIAQAGVELVRTPPAEAPNYAASYEALRIAPVSPMRPGECLIRYQGGRNALRVHGIGRVIYDGGPGTVRWVEDGDDLLLMAAADAADGKAPPPTLAHGPPCRHRKRSIAIPRDCS
jgi:hypothetical protein